MTSQNWRHAFGDLPAEDQETLRVQINKINALLGLPEEVRE